MSAPLRYELLGYGFVGVAALYLYPAPIWKSFIIISCCMFAWECWNVKK